MKGAIDVTHPAQFEKVSRLLIHTALAEPRTHPVSRGFTRGGVTAMLTDALLTII